MNECQCGCGAEVKGTWKHGHNRRVGFNPLPQVSRRRSAEDYAVTESGCWEWQGYIRKDGYGECDPRFLGLEDFGAERTNGQWRALVHRVFYTIHVGPIPDGLIVRHKCDNPPCVNPDHLELGTRTDNAQDRVERGRTRLGRVPQDFCKRGHDLNDPANVRRTKSPHGVRRRCRACARILASEARARD